MGFECFLSFYRFLGRGRLLLLRENVELVKVALNVAVREIFALLHAQHLTHGSVRVDRVTLLGILQLVAVHVGAEGASDISRGHLRALGLAQEAAQLVLQRHRGGKDGGALFLDHAIFALLLGATAAATSLLNLLGNTLLQLLQRLDGGNRLIAQLLVQRDQVSNLLLNRLRLNGNRISHRGGNGSGLNYRGSRSSGLSSGRLLSGSGNGGDNRGQLLR